uniref:mitogen-activated protein kinase kinase kinase n=1 Tax=Fagus sylvatica TaxID=28930 RepID=A0A2N9HL25_FAGSY
MSYFHKAFSSSYVSAPKHDDGNVGNFVENSGQSGINRRLTRQRKLRHVTDQDLGLGSPDPSPDSTRKSRYSPTEFWSFSAVPQPLPLPGDYSLTRRSESTGQAAHFGSPKEANGSVFARNNTENAVTASIKPTSNCHRKFSQDMNVEYGKRNLRVKIPDRSGLTSDLVSPTVSPHLRPKSQEFFPPFVTTSSAKDSTNYHRGFSPQDLKVGGYNHNSKLNFLAKSAPSSGYSSPAVSPRRPDFRDFFPSSVAFQEFQERIVGCSSKVSPVKNMRSPDHSPLRSPTAQSPHATPKSPNRSAIASHHKFLSEGHMDWPENNNHVSAHPLPLPPRAILPSQSSMQSQSTTTHHIAEQPHVSSFKGQWQKGKQIGRGTFGSVYYATNRETGASCAMKVVDLIPDDPKSAESVKQLEQVDDHLCIYLEYVHPGSVDKYVRENFGAITESIVRNFTRHILTGLAFLHSTKTIHRDIKGANLLVDASGVVKLADFGLAKHLAGQSYNLSLKGSPYWMAPEVMQATMQKKDANPDLALAIDIWSLGCTIIEMLNGKPPWSDFSGPQAMFKVLNSTPPIPETLSSEGKDFLHCCFRRNPAERPTAIMLLEHSFVRNSHDQNITASTQAFSAMNLIDKPHTVGDGPRHKDPMSVSPGTRIVNGNHPRSGGTCQHYNAKTYNCIEPFHRPSSTMLQVRPSLSTTQLIHSSHSFSPSSNISSNVPLGAMNNHPCAIVRTHGRKSHTTEMLL